MDITVMLADVAGVAIFSCFAAGGEFTPGFDLERDEIFLVQYTQAVDDPSPAEEEVVVLVVQQDGRQTGNVVCDMHRG